MRAPVAAALAIGLCGALLVVNDSPAQPRSVYELGRAAIGAAEVLDRVTGLRLEAERRIRSPLNSTPDVSRITVDFVAQDGYLETLAFSKPLIGQRIVPGNVYGGFRGTSFIRRQDEPVNSVFRPMEPERKAAALSQWRRRATELAGSLLLTEHTPLPVRYAHAGTAEAGDQKADVLDVTCADGYRFQLFLDAGTHRVLMMVPGPGGGLAPRSRPDQPQRWFFADHRPAAGLTLPHTIVHERDGVTDFEWAVERYTINPPVPPDLRR